MSSPAPASTSEAVSTLRSQLTALSTGGASHRELGEKYRSILDSVLTWKETDLVEGLKAFIEAIINENVSLVISRQVMNRSRSVCTFIWPPFDCTTLSIWVGRSWKLSSRSSS